MTDVPQRRARCLLAGLLLTGLSACLEEDYVGLYQTHAIAPSLTEAQVRNFDVLGPTLVDGGVNFSVFSHNAERMELLIFQDPEADRPDQRFEMKRFGDVWNVHVEGVGRGTAYGYVAWGPNWTYDEAWYPGSIAGFHADVDALGNRFNPNKLLQDPWAKVLHRDHDWGRASLGTGPDRTQSSWGAAAKSLVWEPMYTWSDHETTWMEARQKNEAPYHDWNELVVYEVHPKGFTADAASGVLHPGTYRGIGEKAAYLADLGITAVELLPIHEKPLDGGYWGYNNISFFAPEISYASGCNQSAYAPTCEPLEIIAEFKWMVDQLHQQGVEVWVDVVYNHTGEGGLWRERIYQDDVSLVGSGEGFYNLDPQEVASLYSFRGLDNASWYKLPPDGLTYWNNTGVGNQVRTNSAVGRRLVMDSLRWMVEELHVDGFRFDLAPVLGETDDAYNVYDATTTVLQDIADDPVLLAHHSRVVAEPWSVCNGCGWQLGNFPASKVADGVGWGEWNGWYRDLWRQFINGVAIPEDGGHGYWHDDRGMNDANGDADVGYTLTGSYSLFGDDGRRPYHSLNFITVHDGFTLYDSVTYEERINGCSPLNPVCCDDPTSPWCQQDNGEEYNRSRDWGEGVSGPEGEALKRQMMRNFFTAMMISHGTPMILGGDEYMRTQLGNNNAYSTGADNPFNWHEWGKYVSSPDRVRMHDFVRKLIAFRMDHLEVLGPKEYRAGDIITWRNAANTGEPDWGSRHMMVRYRDPDGVGEEVLVLLNMERGPVSFSLPQGSWAKVIDTQRWWDFDNVDSDQDFFDQTAADVLVSHNATPGTPEVVSGSFEAADSSFVILVPAGAGE